MCLQRHLTRPPPSNKYALIILNRCATLLSNLSFPFFENCTYFWRIYCAQGTFTFSRLRSKFFLFPSLKTAWILWRGILSAFKKAEGNQMGLSSSFSKYWWFWFSIHSQYSTKSISNMTFFPIRSSESESVSRNPMKKTLVFHNLVPEKGETGKQIWTWCTV